MKVTIETTEKVLRLQLLLKQLSQLSYNFSSVNKNYPLDQLDEEQAGQLISLYERFLHEASRTVNRFLQEEQEKGGKK